MANCADTGKNDRRAMGAQIPTGAAGERTASNRPNMPVCRFSADETSHTIDYMSPVHEIRRGFRSRRISPKRFGMGAESRRQIDLQITGGFRAIVSPPGTKTGNRCKRRRIWARIRRIKAPLPSDTVGTQKEQRVGFWMG